MAIVKTDDRHYADIANAIRERTGTETQYRPGEMAEAISGIPGVHYKIVSRIVANAAVTITATDGEVVLIAARGEDNVYTIAGCHPGTWSVTCTYGTSAEAVEVVITEDVMTYWVEFTAGRYYLCKNGVPQYDNITSDCTVTENDGYLTLYFATRYSSGYSSQKYTFNDVDTSGYHVLKIAYVNKYYRSTSTSNAKAAAIYINNVKTLTLPLIQYYTIKPDVTLESVEITEGSVLDIQLRNASATNSPFYAEVDLYDLWLE